MNQPDTHPRGGSLPPDLAATVERAGPQLGIFARDLQWYKSVSSTNDVAGALAERGAVEGTTVVAHSQTAGRGRRERAWSSPPGSGLYVSVIVRPPAPAVPLLTIAAGVAIADALARVCQLKVTLKWPNDVVTGGSFRKLAGILAEASASQSGVSHVVIGFGINLRRGNWPADVAARATSLEDEMQGSVDRGEVLAECLASLASRYDDLRQGRSSNVVAAWRVHAAPSFGRAVEWDEPGGPRRGAAEGVDETGALIVRTQGGVSRVTSGEVRWL